MKKDDKATATSGIFYDILSGLRRSGRKSLDKMIRKAAKGKIDYIITKSISRVTIATTDVEDVTELKAPRKVKQTNNTC